MEVLLITIIGNAVVGLCTGVGTLLLHKYDRRKMKKRFDQLHEKMDKAVKINEPTSNEPIETPSENNYVQVARNTNFNTY